MRRILITMAGWIIKVNCTNKDKDKSNNEITFRVSNVVLLSTQHHRDNHSTNSLSFSIARTFRGGKRYHSDYWFADCRPHHKHFGRCLKCRNFFQITSIWSDLCPFWHLLKSNPFPFHCRFPINRKSIRKSLCDFRVRKCGALRFHVNDIQMGVCVSLCDWVCACVKWGHILFAMH